MFKKMFSGIAVAVVCASAAFADLPTVHNFAPSTVFPRQVSVLTIEIQNSDTAVETAVGFSKQLPLGIEFATSGPNIRTNCNLNPATTVSASGTDSFTLTDASIPAGDGVNNGSCTVQLDVTGISEGAIVYQILPGEVESLDSGATNPIISSASLTVVVTPPTIGLSAVYDTNGPAPGVGVNRLRGGTTVDATIAIRNTNPVDLLGGQFNIPLDGGLVPVVGSTVTFVNCGTPDPDLVLDEGVAPYGVGGVGTPGNLAVSNISLSAAPAGGSTECRIGLNLIPTADRYRPRGLVSPRPQFEFPAGALTTSESTSNLSGATFRPELAVGLGITKSFSPSLVEIDINDTTTLTINASSFDAETIALDSIVDQLPSGLEYVSAAPNSCGGTTALSASNVDGPLDILTVTGATTPPVVWGGVVFKVPVRGSVAKFLPSRR